MRYILFLTFLLLTSCNPKPIRESEKSFPKERVLVLFQDLPENRDGYLPAFEQWAKGTFNPAKFQVEAKLVTVGAQAEEAGVDKRPKGIFELLKVAEEGEVDLLVLVGRFPDKTYGEVLKEIPTTRVLFLDTSFAGKPSPNVRIAKIAYRDLFFLGGAIGGLMTVTNVISLLVDESLPYVAAAEKYFKVGAVWTRPNIRIARIGLKVISRSKDVSAELAESLEEIFNVAQADVLFTVTDSFYADAQESATRHRNLSVGYGWNRDKIGRGGVVTSVVKRYDRAIYLAVKNWDRWAASKPVVLGASEGVVDISGFAEYERNRGPKPEVTEPIMDVLDKLVHGDIEIEE